MTVRSIWWLHHAVEIQHTRFLLATRERKKLLPKSLMRRVHYYVMMWLLT